jgi:hypothetical protein
MPRISAFYGIVIRMYWNESDHQVAHLHAFAGGQRASVTLDGSMLAGTLEPRAYGLVVEWAALHRDELQATGIGRDATSRWWRSRRCRRIRLMSSYLPSVVGVAVLGDHLLRLLFDDGTVGDVQFAQEHLYGVLEPLRDPSYFARVRVDPEAGTIAWPNGEDWAPEDLYETARARALTPS